MPAYQADASSALNIISTNSSGAACAAPTGKYCREAPDVSADADPDTGYVLAYDGSWTQFGGTSGSAPLWAAFMALVDSSSACDGTKIGFANPMLYGLASNPADYANDFNDVTSGSDDAYGTENGLYPAGSGYDMATGLGTPNGANLASDLCDGQTSVVTVTDPGSQTTTVGDATSLQISATDLSGANLTYSAQSLPAGLSLDPADGLISGAPTTAGTSSVAVTVTDADGAAGTADFTWQVNAVPVVTPPTGTAPVVTPPSGTTSVTPPSTTTPVVTPPVVTPSPRVTVEKPTVGKVAGGKARITIKLSCATSAESCETYTFVGKAGKQTVVAGKGALKAGKSIRIRLKLNATGVRLLKARGELKVRLVIKAEGELLKTKTVSVTRARAKTTTQRTR